MTMSVEVPTDLQPFIQNVLATGKYDSEQQVVEEILRLAAGSLEGYQELKEGVARSIEDEQAGRVKKVDFSAARQRLVDELDEAGQPE